MTSHPDRRRSWISGELVRTHTPVLFVSDSGTADVYIYNLTTLKRIGTITGFDQPQGECSDNRGNVWITDTNGQVVYELSHQGRLENELVITGGYPDACAWDSKTGDLAVMEMFQVNSSGGAVLVYPKGSGYPKSYTNPGQYYYNFGSYDASGNLFFDGRDSNGNFMLSKLGKGSTSASTVKITHGVIYFPGMVQWDSVRNDLIVGDQACGNAYVSCVYRVTITQTSGRIDGKTRFENYAGGQVCDLIQGVELVQNSNQIAGSDYDFCGGPASATYLWPYTRGGAPTRYNKTVDSTPVGAAISK